MLNNLKNKKVIILVLLVALIVVFALSLSRRTQGPASITELEDPQPFDERVTTHTESADIETAEDLKDSIFDDLPIYNNNFEASSGITTEISIFTTSYDPLHILRVSIIGVDYTADPSNKRDGSIVAFKESFEWVKSELESRNADPKAFYFLFNSTQEDHETASMWVEELGLLD